MRKFKAMKYHIKYHIFKKFKKIKIRFCFVPFLILLYITSIIYWICIHSPSAPYNEARGNGVSDARNASVNDRHINSNDKNNNANHTSDGEQDDENNANDLSMATGVRDGARGGCR